jgi:PAS domain S-box-containing protein
MSKKTVALPKTELRKRAEAKLSKQKDKTQPVKKADTLRLVHELQVHQIELEMQNEELAHARAEAEAALSQFTDLYDFAPVGYFTLTRDGAIKQANLTGAALLGAGAERGKLLKRRFGLYVSPKSRPDFNVFLEKVFNVSGAGSQLKQTCEVELLQDKTAALWVRVDTTMDKNGETCSAVVSDITARKQAEESLRASEEKFRILNTLAPAGIYLTDTEGNCLYTNPRWNEMAGLSYQAALGKGWGNGLHPDDREIVFSNWKKMVKSEGNWGMEYRFQTPEGKVTWVYGLATAQRDASGKIIQYVGLNMDITERKQVEAEIRQLNAHLEQRVKERTQELLDAQEKIVRQEKLTVLGQMAGSVSHELRNPLGVISNAVYFLKMVQPDASEEVKEYLKLIEKNIHISDKIIGDLLDFTRVKSSARESVAVSDLIRQTLERFPAPESVQVTLDLPADLPKAYADPQQVLQVLSNLTLNACQAMASTDSTTGVAAGGQLAISADVQEDMIRIAVQDTGVGIAPENMNNLFEPLFTTKPKGIGLGLAVSQKLIEANGGRIEVESDGVPGKGSIFIVWLPMQK